MGWFLGVAGLVSEPFGRVGATVLLMDLYLAGDVEPVATLARSAWLWSVAVILPLLACLPVISNLVLVI
jgi:hypothetical protein